MPGRRRIRLLSERRLVPLLLVAPLLVFMLVFYLLPVLAMLMRSVAEPSWTLENYQALAGDSVFRNVFWTTLRTAIAVTFGCLLFGYPVALTLVRPGRAAGVALIIVLLPFWTSILVRSYAWMVLLGRRGLLNEALLASGVIDHPLRILNTSIAVHIAMIHILLPYMILPIANALRQIDPSLGRAALGLGATPFRVFREVILPLSMPGVGAGVLLVFVLSLGFYITPALVGGPRDMTVSMLIAQQVDQLNWPYAACLSATLLAATLAIMAVFQRLFGVGSAFRLAGR
ncbi:MAG: putative spermidine/putrescine transport system permease protein [Acetobacteraceae bacterium]|nr:putative spermidine/putrescine transport system permease protein [Acetobacteraceae bacterium]